MRKYFLLLMFCGFLVACQQQPQKPFGYVLKGKLPTTEYDGAKLVFSHMYEGKRVVDTIQIVSDSILYKGTADSAFFGRLDGYPTFANFIVEAGTIQVDLEGHVFPSGTPLNDLYAEIERKEADLSRGLEERRKSILRDTTLTRQERIDRQNELESTKTRIEYSKQRLEIIKPYILANGDNVLGFLLGVQYLGLATTLPEPVEDICPYLSEWITSKPIIQESLLLLQGVRNRQPGVQFTDFKGEDVEGNPVSLSDYVGKGKYVLVDFSASWCTPCHEEIPFITEVYNRFKDKDFEVLTVVVWDKLERARKFLKESDFPWKSMLELSGNAQRVYGISGIPHLILFAPNGKVIDCSLRRNEIMPQVEKAIGEK